MKNLQCVQEHVLTHHGVKAKTFIYHSCNAFHYKHAGYIVDASNVAVKYKLHTKSQNSVHTRATIPVKKAKQTQKNNCTDNETLNFK